MEPVVCIVWASRKRHIAFDRKLLCKKEHKPGYSKGGHYNYDLDPSVFEQRKEFDDVDYGPGRGGNHGSGIIDFVPLNEITLKHKPGAYTHSHAGVIERSICKKCLAEYKKRLEKKNT